MFNVFLYYNNLHIAMLNKNKILTMDWISEAMVNVRIINLLYDLIWTFPHNKKSREE